MAASAARSLGARRLEAGVVAVAAAVVGFSAAKSAESLRRALGDCGGR